MSKDITADLFFKLYGKVRKGLTLEQKGMLVDAISALINGEELKGLDPTVNSALNQFIDQFRNVDRISELRRKAGILGMQKRWAKQKTKAQEFCYNKNNKTEDNEEQKSLQVVENADNTNKESNLNSRENLLFCYNKNLKEESFPPIPPYKEENPKKIKNSRQRNFKILNVEQAMEIFTECANSMHLEIPKCIYDSFYQFVQFRTAGKYKLTAIAIKQSVSNIAKCFEAGASADLICGFIDYAVQVGWVGWFFRDETLKKIKAKNFNNLKKTPPQSAVSNSYEGVQFAF